jgi:isopentenyl-diphosphate delta-isomerase
MAKPMKILIPAWVDGTLQPVEKLQTHLRGLRHKAVSIFVMQGDKTLLQCRALSKYHTPGLWANACCTHPEWNESGLQCAIRRLDEELGIFGQTPVYRDTVEYRADVGGGMIEHEVVEIFVVQAAEISIQPNVDEVMDYRWESLKDLAYQTRERPQEFTPWLKIYLNQHSKTIFGDQIG